MGNPIFIAREKPLTQLSECLMNAVGGHGGVCFISGEAGSGKTTLVKEFTRQAQMNHQHLTVAVGLCDAQTGIGDAYLPFREVLGQLTGEVETKLTVGAVNEENANRLRNMLVLAGQAIVDVGPDLIGVFVPGIGLATKLGTFVAEKTGWLNKLEKLVSKPKAKLGESDLQESHIFEQYASVLCRISEKNPLLIFLDDLHWADSASINLLFHLGRRIEEHKILILGTYRSAEVGIGRDKERHPLEKTLAEFKRYFGDITIDLDNEVEEEGKQFVEALLESEPNSLCASFIANLYQHTGGHPLFTVELLRNMQERGDLVKDGQGKWVESESLDWDKLPTKVEGVIEERIGRLQQELKEVLRVGSVQGEDFTAEVVARVQQAETRDLVRQLSSELERQHRLVRSEGIMRLESGGQRLSLFRFQHNLFRTYLYNELSEAEKVYLHEDVGNALEALYGNQAEEIAVDLALHFEKAGIDEKARHYLQKAGEQAATSFANAEAIDYLTRALALTPDSDYQKRYELILLREKVLSLQGFREKQAEDLAQLFSLAEILDDDFKRGEVTLQQASFDHDTGNFQSAIESAKTVINIAKLIPSEEFLARGQLMWGVSAHVMGNYTTAEEYMLQALKSAQAANLIKIEASSLRGLGMIAGRQGDFNKAIQYYQESRDKCEQIGDSNGANRANNNLGLVLCSLGKFLKAKEYYQEALVFFKKIGDRRVVNVVLCNLGAACANQGDYQSALSYLEESLEISRSVGDLKSEAITLDNLGKLWNASGEFQRSKKYMLEALEINQKIGNRHSELINLISLAILYHDMCEYSAAIELLDTALGLTHELEVKTWEISILMEYGSISVSLGDYQKAEAYYSSAYDIVVEINDQQRAPFIWSGRAYLYCQMKHYEESNKCCQKALELAQALGDKEREANVLLTLCDILIGMEDINKAEEVLKQSMALIQDINLDSLVVESKICLAQIAWLRGNFEQALHEIKGVSDAIQNTAIEKPDISLLKLFNCFKILKANHDTQAEDILRKAHSILMGRAEKITDETMRTSYLENVTINREIQEEYSRLP